MNSTIIILPENKKAIAAINTLNKAKAAFKIFIAKGGNLKDFKKNEQN